MRLLIWTLAVALYAQEKRIENLAPYTPTPDAVVGRMLKLAGLQAGEKMFDLGSGDGRIVIAAAKQFKADATGVEFDDALFKASMRLIDSLGLAARARIIKGDLLKQDYSSADVLTIYLLPVANIKLTPIFEKQLKKGARIVSHNADFRAWTPLKIEEIENDGDGKSHRLYLYQR